MRKFYSLIFNGTAFKSKSPKWILGLFVVLLGMVPGQILGQVTSITLNSISSTSICPGGTLDVTFTSNATGLNTYTAQLSDNTGSFTTPTDIGTVNITGDASGAVIPATIPAGTAAGTGYLIRVISGAVIGGNSSVITLNPTLPVSVSIASDAPGNTICAGSSITFTATPNNGGLSPLYQWQINGLNVGLPSSVNTFTSDTFSVGKSISVVLTSNASPCATGSPATSNYITVTVNQNPTATAGTALSAICQGATSAVMNGSVGGGATGGTWSGGAGTWTN
ncbi:MAG TPA: hypothetical protein VFI29_03330, partial [Hanamia sp.]|nr:hypothetical protein [Hanamia sp.]